MTKRLMRRVPSLPPVDLPDLDRHEADVARALAEAKRDEATARRLAYEDRSDPLVGDILRAIYTKGVAA